MVSEVWWKLPCTNLFELFYSDLVSAFQVLADQIYCTLVELWRLNDGIVACIFALGGIRCAILLSRLHLDERLSRSGPVRIGCSMTCAIGVPNLIVVLGPSEGKF